MKKILVIILLVLSIGLNIFLYSKTKAKETDYDSIFENNYSSYIELNDLINNHFKVDSYTELLGD